jgi:hypothetical protein
MFCSRQTTIVLLWLIFAIAACSKKDEPKVIARVGDIAITVDEFRKRFEFNPRLQQFKDSDQAKIRFLGSLIAEKLLALNADKQGLTPSPRTKAFLEQINRETVIEEFYNQKIATKIQIEEKELRQTYEKSRRELEVQYTAFKSLEEAHKFRERVLSGEPFEEAKLKSIAKAGNSWIGVDTLSLRWGQATPAIEEALYRLKPREISEPIAASNEFYVARILSEKTDAFGTVEDFQRSKEKIEKILAKRKKSAAFVDYFKKMMVGKKTQIPPERFKYVVESLETAFAIGDSTTEIARTINPSPISDREFSQAQQSLQVNLKEVLVTFDNGTRWTIREFLQRLSVGRHYLDFSNKESFRRGLRQALITMIEQEYIYKEGLKEGLHQSSVVEEEVAIWRENLAAHRLVQQLLSQDERMPDENQPPYLTDEQLAILTNRLLSLSSQYDITIDVETLNTLQVSSAGFLALKTHFPGRLVVPIEIPLENLSAWQERILTLLKHSR